MWTLNLKVGAYRIEGFVVIELVVTHDGTHWIAKNDDLRVQATTLAKLDSEVKRVLGQLRDIGDISGQVAGFEREYILSVHQDLAGPVFQKALDSLDHGAFPRAVPP